MCRFHGGGTAAAREAGARNVRHEVLAKKANKLMPDAEVMADPEKSLRESAGVKEALVIGQAALLSRLTKPEEIATAQEMLLGYMRALDATNVALLQHGTVTDEEDDLSGLERLEALLEEVESRRDATHLPCPSCEGLGYLPRFAEIVQGTTVEPDDEDWDLLGV